MDEVWKDLGIRQHKVEQLSILWYKVAMRQKRLVPGKHSMESLILEIMDAELKS